ncbi:MAG: hypothetical protein ACF8Q5_12035 [Phycisphaerales bacterium JB040]
MMHPTTRACLAGLAFLTLTACTDDPDGKKISRVADHMSGELIEDASDANQSYNEILTTLNSLSGSPSAGIQEAAAVLEGAAKSGLASTKAEEAQALEFRLREMSTVLRATVSKWQRLDAQARAAEQISVDEELAEIAALVQRGNQERETNLADKAEYDSQIAELNTQIQDFQARAAEQRNQAGELQLQLSRVSASEAATLAERIREFTLRADELERRASELTTTRDQITPEAREASLNVEKIETQLRLLDRQRAEAQAREQAAREDAETARRSAEAVKTELLNLARELTAFVEGELTAGFQQVISEINASQQAVRAASDIARNSASLHLGVSNQAKGIILSRESDALAQASGAFRTIAAAGPVPSAEQTADDLLQRARDAHTAACEAFAAGASNLNSVRLEAEYRDIQDRLREAGEALTRLSETPFGGVPEFAPPAPEPAFGDEPAEEEGFIETNEEI